MTVWPSFLTIHLKDAIPCRAARGLNHEFKAGRHWVAEMRRHPLKGDRSFYAELTQYITLVTITCTVVGYPCAS